MDENSIDVARKWKFSHIYDKLDEPARKKIKMDEVALFSVTKESDSEVMVNQLTKYLPHTALVTDGCACVGGNTSYFAKYFNRVKAYEIDPERYKLLLNNLEVYGVGRKCECYNEDFTKVIDNVHEDLVFLDPPWGGEDYLTHETLELEMSGLTTKEIVSKLRGHTRYIYLKVPQNFDFQAIYNYNKDIVELEKQSFVISTKKGTFYYTVLLEFNNPNNGIIWNSYPRTNQVNNRKQLNIENIRINDLETNDDCICYCYYINSLLTQYSYNTTILDMTSSSLGLLFVHAKKILDQPNTLIGIEKNQIRLKCSLENYEKYFPHNQKNKYPVKYYPTIADYLSNNNNNNNNNTSSDSPKEFIIFHHITEESKIKTIVPGILNQYINQVTLMIIVINEKLSDIRINNVLPEGFSAKVDTFERRGKKCYFLVVYKTQNYFVKNEVLINCFTLNNALKQLVKDFLNLRYNRMCKEFEGFAYQNLKDTSIENSKSKSNYPSRKNDVINKDEIIIKKFKTNYENDSKIKEIYMNSESSKLPPYILGRPISKVERIYDMIKDQNPSISPKNILIIGVIDCDISHEIHNKYPASKITSIDILKSYKPLYGSYNYRSLDSVDFVTTSSSNNNNKYDIIIIQSLHHYIFQCLLIDNLRDNLDDKGYIVLCEMHCNDSTVAQFYQFLHLFHYHFLMNIDICPNNLLFRPISDWTMLFELCQYDLLKSYPSVVSYYTLMMQIYKKREKSKK